MKNRVEIINNGSCKTQVRINDKAIRCYGYDISQSVGYLPEIELQLMPDNIDLLFEDSEIIIKDLRQIAELMDEELFNQFCEIWKDKHDKNLHK